MTIKAKILVLVAAFAVMASAITGLSLLTIGDYNRLIDEYQSASADAFRGEQLNRYVLDIAVETRGLYLSGSDDIARQRADRVDASVDRMAAFLGHWRAIRTPGSLPELDLVDANMQKIITGVHTTARLARTQSLKAADGFGNHIQYSSDREVMQGRIDAMVARLTARAEAAQQRLDRLEQERQSQFLLMAGSGILIMLGGSLWIAVFAIGRPLMAVRNAIVSVADGAYDTPIPPHTEDDAIGRVWTALDILKDRAAEAERLTQEKLAEEHRLRELILD
ncbi:hypothetical protein [Asticcacaulis solisilvae]|uniref:hypothetical protein n=1 Tax=Asticcacaulis solisilvae TaxID=1217274 RepID=UPI003FD6CA71